MKTPVRNGSVLLTAALLVAAMATPALAWSNGPGGPDFYGTHDWILDKAINAPSRAPRHFGHFMTVSELSWSPPSAVVTTQPKGPPVLPPV